VAALRHIVPAGSVIVFGRLRKFHELALSTLSDLVSPFQGLSLRRGKRTFALLRYLHLFHPPM
jgi:hypothetical protein